ncbi:MAG: SLATT domain-containing protein [Candidatus Paceibacterota bacterium]|jgi:hypothetical protein
MKDKYIKECEAIKQNCTYTGEAHHIIADKQKRLAGYFQIIPAVVAAVLGVLVGSGSVPSWFIWLSVISAVVAAVGNVLNPLKDYYDNLNAAKNFVTLKQDARSLEETFSAAMSDAEFATATKSLHDRYNDLVRFAPPTDKKSFEEAQKRVKSGVHELD